MTEQVGAGPEGLVTILACVVLLPGVDSSVDNQGVAPGKTLSAKFAHVRLDVAVPRDDVVLQVTPLPKLKLALVAFKGFHAGIYGGYEHQGLGVYL